MELFVPRLKRFLFQNPAEAESRKRRGWHKIKWAILDKHKFQLLVHELKELIDHLLLIRFNQALPVDADQLDSNMRMDIELINNVAQLSLVEEAREDSYRAWSAHAGSVRAASIAGTIDRRNFEEWSRDLEPIDPERLPETLAGTEHNRRSLSCKRKKHFLWLLLQLIRDKYSIHPLVKALQWALKTRCISSLQDNA
jgi:hypothetical protein